MSGSTKSSEKQKEILQALDDLSISVESIEMRYKTLLDHLKPILNKRVYEQSALVAPDDMIEKEFCPLAALILNQKNKLRNVNGQLSLLVENLEI